MRLVVPDLSRRDLFGRKRERGNRGRHPRDPDVEGWAPPPQGSNPTRARTHTRAPARGSPIARRDDRGFGPPVSVVVFVLCGTGSTVCIRLYVGRVCCVVSQRGLSWAMVGSYEC